MLDLTNDFLDCVNDNPSLGDGRLVAKNKPAIESSLHVHLMSFRKLAQRESRDLCALFYPDIVWERGVKLLNLRKENNGTLNPHFPKSGSRSHYGDYPVLVSIVDFTKNRKGITPCHVGLQPLDDCPLNIAGSPDVFFSATFEVVGVVEDGEIDILIKERINAEGIPQMECSRADRNLLQISPMIRGKEVGISFRT